MVAWLKVRGYVSLSRDAPSQANTGADPVTALPKESRRRVTRWWERRRGDVFGVSAIVGFVLAYLSPAVKDGWSFGSFDMVVSYTSLGSGAYRGPPHNWLNTDSVTLMVPFNSFDWTAVHHLQFPLWNDLSLLGLPQFLNFQSAVLSLPDLTSYLVPLRFAFLVVVAMKLLIAGTGAYTLCRVLGLRPFASVLGGVTFMLSGAFSSWLVWPLSGVVAWLGWIAALAILAYRWKKKRSYVVLLALSVAFCVYGGFPEAYFFVAAALVTFFVVLAAVTLVRRHRLSPSGVTRVAIGIVAGGVLSAPLWFPGLQIVKGSHRVTLTGFQGIDASTLGLLVAPGYFGLPITGSAWFYSDANYYETVVYVGVVALVLAGAAVLRWWRHPTVVALFVTIVVTLLISYQTKSFHVVSDLLKHSRFDSVTFSRMRAVIGLPVGVLAALGLKTLLREGRATHADRLRKPERDRRRLRRPLVVRRARGQSSGVSRAQARQHVVADRARRGLCSGRWPAASRRETHRDLLPLMPCLSLRPRCSSGQRPPSSCSRESGSTPTARASSRSRPRLRG